MVSRKLIHSDVTERIIQASYSVYNTLGHGFLEKVYENALALELSRMGSRVRQQVNIQVYYHGEVVGDYVADLLVDEKVIVELKASKGISSEHEAQLLNYLRATRYEVGLLINFSTRLDIERRVMSNENKRSVWRT